MWLLASVATRPSGEVRSLKALSTAAMSESSANILIPQQPPFVLPYRYSLDASWGRYSVALISGLIMLSIFSQAVFWKVPILIRCTVEGKKKVFNASIRCHGASLLRIILRPMFVISSKDAMCGTMLKPTCAPRKVAASPSCSGITIQFPIFIVECLTPTRVGLANITD
ncbi:unnamed protein product [Macrosiphum euphorbiae]|uniref:Uncharacterized protein n=1 Tax=Macrosiphum euphorbiae TaxID=13131 RepID=A0AAV0WME7_9HEMI|nr:unnamed protein product [Macrosiphum euphorbiae]